MSRSLGRLSGSPSQEWSMQYRIPLSSSNLKNRRRKCEWLWLSAKPVGGAVSLPVTSGGLAYESICSRIGSILDGIRISDRFLRSASAGASSTRVRPLPCFLGLRAGAACRVLSWRNRRQGSRGPSPFQNYGNGLCQDFEIHPQRPLVDVFHVQLHPFFERDGAAAVDLPEASNPWADTKAATLPVLMESLVIPDGKRPRAYQAHVAFQHVEKLRKLINAGLPQELADACDARIVLYLEHRAARLIQVLDFPLLLFRVCHHGPELVQVKPFLVEADPFLDEEHWPLRSELDDKTSQQEQWCQY